MPLLSSLRAAGLAGLLALAAPFPALDAAPQSPDAPADPAPSGAGPSGGGDAQAPGADDRAPGADDRAPGSWLPQTGRDLLTLARSCKAGPPRTPPELRNCYGFQAGVVIAALTFAHNAGAKPPFCVPDGLSDRALSDAVAGYIATTPKAAGAPAVAAIYAAMVASYPCP